MPTRPAPTNRSAWFRSWQTACAPWPSELRAPRAHRAAAPGPAGPSRSRENSGSGVGAWRLRVLSAARAASSCHLRRIASRIWPLAADRTLCSRFSATLESSATIAIAIDEEMSAVDPRRRRVLSACARIRPRIRRRPHRANFNRRRGFLRRQVACHRAASYPHKPPPPSRRCAPGNS